MSTPKKKLTRGQRFVASVIALAVFALNGGWALMLLTPLYGLHLGYWHAVASVYLARVVYRFVTTSATPD